MRFSSSLSNSRISKAGSIPPPIKTIPRRDLYFTRDPNRARTSASSSEHPGANILLACDCILHRPSLLPELSVLIRSRRRAPPPRAPPPERLHHPRGQRRSRSGIRFVPLHRPLAQLGDGGIHATERCAATATPVAMPTPKLGPSTTSKSSPRTDCSLTPPTRSRQAPIATLGEGLGLAAAGHRIGSGFLATVRKVGDDLSQEAGVLGVGLAVGGAVLGLILIGGANADDAGSAAGGRGAGGGLDRGTVGGKGRRVRGVLAVPLSSGTMEYAPRGEGEGRGAGWAARPARGRIAGAPSRGDPRECLRWRGRGSSRCLALRGRV